MSDEFRKLKKFTTSFRILFIHEQYQKKLYKYFESFKKLQRANSEIPVVLVGCIEDPFYFGLFGQIVSSIREHEPIRVGQFVFRSLNVGESNSIYSYLKFRVINALLNIKWRKLYSSFCDGVGYRSTSISAMSDVVDMIYGWKCWRKIKKDGSVLINLSINAIYVGDLVNDSYLRYKPAPKVNTNDFYLFILLWQVHRDLRRSEKYFSKIRPKFYLSSYSTYIQHGVAVRVALKHNTKVYCFGNYQEFTKRLTNSDWLHTKCPDGYASDFSHMDEKNVKVLIAEKALISRISGGIDAATAYMNQSAYVEVDCDVPDVSGAVVIFLHDFYDSPHVYRDMVFQDFWEWVCFTIDVLSKENIRFFIKPHPNQINFSEKVLDKLKDCYPSLKFISSSITNKQLVEAGMHCAVTVYGTVAHEMAYLGVPTISCARHPHISFDFCLTARNNTEYASFLENSVYLRIDKDELRKQSLMFYYMHNLNMNSEDKMLRDYLMVLRQTCSKSNLTGEKIISNLIDLSALPAFRKNISMWLGLINET